MTTKLLTPYSTSSPYHNKRGAQPYPTLGAHSVARYFPHPPDRPYYTPWERCITVRVLHKRWVGGKRPSAQRVLFYVVCQCDSEGTPVSNTKWLVPWQQLAYEKRAKKTKDVSGAMP